jgi:serine/threonine protein kinase
VLLSVARRSLTAPPGGAATEDDEPPLTPGTVLAERYRVHDLVGRGGMGRGVPRRAPALGQHVAVKVLRASQGAQADIVRRFQREAVAASSIRHPGIVEVTDFGRTPDGRFYLAMELVEGETLARRLARLGAASAGRGVSLVRELARALGAAHAAASTTATSSRRTSSSPGRHSEAGRLRHRPSRRGPRDAARRQPG